VERTHLLKHDLDWAPRSYRLLSRAVRMAVIAAPTGLIGGLLFALHSHPDPYFVYMFFGIIPGSAYVGDSAARAIMGRRLRRLARGEVDVARLRDQEDGELVHVRGKVRGQQTTDAFLDGSPAVFRRVIFEMDDARRRRRGWGVGPVVHEAAVDFALVDASGEAITVEVDGARLLAQPSRKREDYGQEEFFALPLPAAVLKVVNERRERAAAGKPTKPVKASEVLLRDGDEVEVVGYKSRRVDPTVATLSRETPMRASLRSGKQLPLLILPVG
jgi:hypothetical protein